MQPIIRRKVYDAICELTGPHGVTSSALADYMGMTLCSVRSAMKHLNREGQIRSQGHKITARWWPADYSGEVKKVDGYAATDNAVLAAVRKIGRYAALRDIMDRIGMSTSAVQGALKRLSQDGRLLRHGRPSSAHSCYGLPGMAVPPPPDTRRIRRHLARIARLERKTQPHPHRQSVLDYIQASGMKGCAGPEIAAHLGVASWIVSRQIRDLLVAGQIRRAGRTKHARYYPRLHARKIEAAVSVDEFLAKRGPTKCPDGFAFGSGWLCEPPAKPDAAPYSRFVTPHGGTFDLARDRGLRKAQMAGKGL